MSITIDGVPEHLTREQYVAIFVAAGFDPSAVIELRAAHDGIHALVLARDENGQQFFKPDGPATGGGQRAKAAPMKHRVFIPVRDDDTDTRTTRVTAVGI